MGWILAILNFQTFFLFYSFRIFYELEKVGLNIYSTVSIKQNNCFSFVMSGLDQRQSSNGELMKSTLFFFQHHFQRTRDKIWLQNNNLCHKYYVKTPHCLLRIFLLFNYKSVESRVKLGRRIVMYKYHYKNVLFSTPLRKNASLFV